MKLTGVFARFAGLLGAILMIFVVPIFVVLLVLDLALWYRHHRKVKTIEVASGTTDVFEAIKEEAPADSADTEEEI